jgi:hypothetical protein
MSQNDSDSTHKMLAALLYVALRCAALLCIAVRCHAMACGEMFKTPRQSAFFKAD